MSRILVTGGAGFIGSFVVDVLVEHGHEVRVVDSLHPAAHHEKPAYLNSAAEHLWGDLGDPDVANRAVAGIDAVSHQASMVGLGVDFGDVTDYVANNDLATAVLLRALHDRQFAGRIVLASSMVVYGDGNYRCDRHGRVRAETRSDAQLRAGQWEVACPSCNATLVPHAVSEDTAADPRNVYAATKLHQEHLVAAYGREHDAPTIALRYHNVYGPRMPRDTPYAGVASIFRSAIEAGRAPLVFEDGGQLRDFVHVRDIARANRLALEADSPCSGPLNVASGEPRTVFDLADALCRSVGDGSLTPRVVGRYRLGDVRHVFAATDAIRERLGFSPEVMFADGVEEFAIAPLRT